ncbi:hypothetical protein K438DRAFT_1550507, partial [Mycena galopus ATCC 62051]
SCASQVYRCWMLWNRNYLIVCLHVFMTMGSVVSEYMVCALFSKAPPGSTVFSGSIDSWITTFNSLAVAQNIITTSLMAWRIAGTDRRAAPHRLGKSNLIPI